MDDDLICDEVDLCPEVPTSQFEIKNNQKLAIEQDQKSYFLKLGFPDQGNDRYGIGCSDFDKDGIVDLLDNCPTLANPNQENHFCGKFLGDHCEDQDQDSVPNADDLNPLDPMTCLDSDLDLCDDCSRLTIPTPNMDGMDLDGDGLCDMGGFRYRSRYGCEC